MSHPDPKRAIIDRLAAPPGHLISQSSPTTGGWRSSTRGPGGEDADPSSVEFVKERGRGGHQLHFVRFRTTAGDQREYIVGVMEQPDGRWEVLGSAGGGGADPPRDHPWINFGAWGWPGFFYGGGRVIGRDSERATRARLRFSDGTTLEDSVDADVVLFMSHGSVQMPATVEILDGTGSVLATHEAFKGL
jgi:hypothetical protein